MSDHLDELKRQRALVAAHLAWLDREIAAGETVEGARSPEREPRAPATPMSLPAADSVQSDPDEIIARYRDEKDPGTQLSKRGCWTIFYGVLLLGVVAVSLLIYLRYY